MIITCSDNFDKWNNIIKSFKHKNDKRKVIKQKEKVQFEHENQIRFRIAKSTPPLIIDRLTKQTYLSKIDRNKTHLY